MVMGDMEQEDMQADMDYMAMDGMVDHMEMNEKIEERMGVDDIAMDG